MGENGEIGWGNPQEDNDDAFRASQNKIHINSEPLKIEMKIIYYGSLNYYYLLLFLLNHECTGEHGTPRILSSCTCLHFHKKQQKTCKKSAARAGPEETSLLSLSQPSQVRCLRDSFNIKLHNSFNNAGSVGITSRMDPTNHQLINNFNLLNFFLELLTSRKPNEFTFMATSNL